MGLFLRFVVIILVFMVVIVTIIYVDQGQRRIPVSFAKRVRGRRVMGGQNTYIPLKVNTAGVIPVIFATSMLLFPSLIVTAIPSDAAWVQALYRWVDQNLGGGGQISWWYVLLLFSLIIFFTYFYNAIQFDPAGRRRCCSDRAGLSRVCARADRLPLSWAGSSTASPFPGRCSWR